MARCRMSERGRMICRIGMGVSGVITGITVSLLFGLHFHTYHAAVWGFISGIFAAVVLVLNILEFRNYWNKARVSHLFGLFIFGVVTSVLAAIAFIIYVTFAIISREGIIVYGNSYWMGSVWASMTLKWTGMLAWFAWIYYKKYKFGEKSEKKTSQELTSSDVKTGETPDTEEKEPMVSPEKNASEKV